MLENPCLSPVGCECTAAQPQCHQYQEEDVVLYGMPEDVPHIEAPAGDGQGFKCLRCSEKPQAQAVRKACILDSMHSFSETLPTP